IVKGSHTYNSGGSHTITTSVSEIAGPGGILVDGSPGHRHGTKPPPGWSHASSGIGAKWWFALRSWDLTGTPVVINSPVMRSSIDSAQATGATSVPAASPNGSSNELAAPQSIGRRVDTTAFDLYFRLLGEFEASLETAV